MFLSWQVISFDSNLIFLNGVFLVSCEKNILDIVVTRPVFLKT